jgi:hypothetical protein
LYVADVRTAGGWGRPNLGYITNIMHTTESPGLIAKTDRSVSVEVVDPGIPVGTGLLAGRELPLVALVLQPAPILLFAASRGAVGEVAAEHVRVVERVERYRVADPVDQLL